MNRKTIYYVLLSLIFPIAFNGVFFLLAGTEHPASVWIAYGFIHFAYVVFVGTPLLVKEGKSSVIREASLSMIAKAYCVVEFFVGLIFILVSSESYKGSLIIQGLLAAAFAVVFIPSLLASDQTAENEKQRAVEINYVKSAASKAKMLMEFTSDAQLKKKIEALYDLIHSSPSKSDASVKGLESEVMIMLGELEMLLMDNKTEEAGKLVFRIQCTMKERNRLVSLSY